MVLAFCNFLMTLYYCIKFHLIPLYTFRGKLRTGFLLQKLKKGMQLRKYTVLQGYDSCILYFLCCPSINVLIFI